MKVNGQLEKAQFEQIASTSPTPTPTGRFYTDITAPTAALPKFYNGTAWKTLAYLDAGSIISQNSGTAVTVDWSTGLYQQVVLTGHCVISFSNPQANQTHRLFVTQKTYTAAGTQYQYKLNMIDQDPRRGPYQPVSVLPFEDTAVFQWYYKTAIRAGYATVPAILSSPTPASFATGLSIHPAGKAITFGLTGSPFQSSLPAIDGGNKFFLGTAAVTQPTLVARAVGTAYSPDGSLFVAVSGTTPFAQMFSTEANGSPIGAAYANPVTLPAAAATSVDFHPSGTHVAVGHGTTPFMSVYPVSAAGWGTKLTNPVSLPAAQVNSLEFSQTGDYLAVASQTTPFLEVYVFDPIAGTVGAKSASPNVLPAGGPAGSLGKGVAWRPQGDYIAIAMTTTPFLSVFGFNRATGAFTATKLDGSSLASATSVAWTPDGQYLLVGTSTTPFLKIYDFSNNDLSTAVTFDGSAPAVQVNDITIHPNGEVVFIALNVTPFLAVYNLPTKARNYLRL